jgi:hypothetical protein
LGTYWSFVWVLPLGLALAFSLAYLTAPLGLSQFGSISAGWQAQLTITSLSFIVLIFLLDQIYRSRYREGVIQTFIKYEGVISGIAKQAVNLIAQNLPGFLEGILNEAGKSADGLFELFGAAFQLARMFYFLFETITQILKALSILAPVFKLIGTLLSNEMVQSVVLLITLLVSLVGILYGLAGVLSYVASGALGSLLTGIYASIASIPTLIGEIYALNGALGVTAGLVSLITGGLALVAGGLLAVGALDQIKSNLTPEVPSASGSNEFSSSSRGDTIINIDGNVDEPTKQKFVDVATQTSRRDQMTSGNYGLGG